jgi:2-C-methyl-D-erythritol 4-phosphate cytidylyltransferase
MGWVAIVPAAGSGTRLGSAAPKALIELAGTTLLFRALEMLRSVPFERIMIAGPPGHLRDVEALLRPSEGAVAGGATRTASVRLAFAALAPRPGDVVCVHDAARPFVTREETDGVMRAAERSGAAIAATPIVDTVKRVEGGRVVETMDRAGLWAAATPQAFREELLRRALDSGGDGTDEAVLCERLGIPVAISPVSRMGFKVTTPEDLELARAILSMERS